MQMMKVLLSNILACLLRRQNRNVKPSKPQVPTPEPVVELQRCPACGRDGVEIVAFGHSDPFGWFQKAQQPSVGW